MFIEKWVLVIVGLLFVYLAHKVSKNIQDIHGLQYDLNDLEVQVGVLEGEEWAINSNRNKAREAKKQQDYYNGLMSDGEYDGAVGIQRRKEDGKNPKLGTPV